MKKNIIIVLLGISSVMLLVKDMPFFYQQQRLFPFVKNVFTIPDKDFYHDGHGAFSTILVRNATTEVSLIRVAKRIPAHRHPTVDHYLYIISGKAKGTVNGRSRTITAGDFVVLPKGIAHEVVVESKQPLVLLQFVALGNGNLSETQWISEGE